MSDHGTIVVAYEVDDEVSHFVYRAPAGLAPAEANRCALAAACRVILDHEGGDDIQADDWREVVGLIGEGAFEDAYACWCDVCDERTFVSWEYLPGDSEVLDPGAVAEAAKGVLADLE